MEYRGSGDFLEMIGDAGEIECVTDLLRMDEHPTIEEEKEGEG